jgi:amidase
MAALLGSDGVLVLPTAPGPAVPRGMPGAQLEDWRTRLLSLTCVAGLSGLPQARAPRRR